MAISGVYSLVAFTIARRRREIAVRVALGGTRWPWRARPALRHAVLVLFAIPALNYLGSESALHLLDLGQGVWRAATAVDGVAVLTAFAVFTALAFERHAHGSRRTIR